MGNTLKEVAQKLRDANKKVQLIYAFNGSGKTRLSGVFKELIAPKNPETEEQETKIKIMYYNAFTEDLFYWDNDLDKGTDGKLKIQPNNYTHWVLVEQGQEPNIAKYFQYHTNDKLTPEFNEVYTIKDKDNNDVIIPAYSEVRFSYQRGDDSGKNFVKISKGEESCFIWSVFYSLLDQTINVLNVVEKADRETDQFDDLEYVFIDDPVSSLDDNHLIELAVNIAEKIKSSQSELNFIITTHNPLFFNVLYNELNNKDSRYNYLPRNFEKYLLEKLDDGTLLLTNNLNDSPFSYHMHLLTILKDIAISNNIEKFHFNLLRNLLEKTATFLGHKHWGYLITKTNLGDKEPYVKRILNASSHSKHSGEETNIVSTGDKLIFKRLVKEISSTYQFNVNTEDIIL